MVSIVTSILFPCSVLTLTLEVAEWCEVWIGEEGGGEDEEELVEGVRTVVPLAGITRREQRGRGGREGERGRGRVGGERGSITQIGTQSHKHLIYNNPKNLTAGMPTFHRNSGVLLTHVFLQVFCPFETLSADVAAEGAILGVCGEVTLELVLAGALPIAYLADVSLLRAT